MIGGYPETLEDVFIAIQRERKFKEKMAFEDFTNRIDLVMKAACDNGIRFDASGSGVIVEDVETGMRAQLCDEDGDSILTTFPPIFDGYTYKRLK